MYAPTGSGAEVAAMGMAKIARVYHRRVDDVTAYVLAGGKSTRMGRDKAFLELGGQSLLARAVATARGLTQNVVIVGNEVKFAAFGSVVEDVYQERGPLGAIHAALTSSVTELNFVLAVDMPFVEEEFARWLIGEARLSENVVTVPRAGGRLHPLCAVYRKNFAEIAQRSLEAGENKIDRLFSEVSTRVIEEEGLVSAGFSPGMFRNVNTREEWEEVIGTRYRVPSKKT